jgi:hypothetical protein
LFRISAPAKGLAAIAATTPVDAAVRNSRLDTFVLFIVDLRSPMFLAPPESCGAARRQAAKG